MIAPDILTGEWKGPEGLVITITKDGDFLVANRNTKKKKALLSGNIKILFQSDTQGKPTDEGYGYIKVFVANISVGEEKSIIPGCAYAGEGDPAGIRMCELDNYFGRQLRKPFSVTVHEVLSLRE